MPASPSLLSVFWRFDEEGGEVSLLWISPDKEVEDGMEVEEEEEDEVGKEGEEEDTEEEDANVESIDIWW